MALSYQDRLKARRGGGIKKKKPKELKLNATKRVRGKLVYWNPYTKSWSKTKVVRKVEVKKEVPKTRAQKLEEGMATWNTNPGNKAYGAELEGSKMVKKKNNSKTQNNTENQTQNNTDNKTEPKSNKLKIKPTTKGGPVKSGVEYARSKGDDLAGYRRTKDTRITKKLKKAGFTEDRLARLRKDHADWKAKRKKKKKS